MCVVNIRCHIAVDGLGIISDMTFYVENPPGQRHEVFNCTVSNSEYARMIVLRLDSIHRSRFGKVLVETRPTRRIDYRHCIQLHILL